MHKGISYGHVKVSVSSGNGGSRGESLMEAPGIVMGRPGC